MTRRPIPMMIQYDARGRFVRRARYNRALLALWTMQLPMTTIVME